MSKLFRMFTPNIDDKYREKYLSLSSYKEQCKSDNDEKPEEFIRTKSVASNVLQEQVPTIFKKVPPNTKCHVCGMTLSGKRTLKSHIEKVHQRQQKFKCSECPKAFDSKAEHRR